LLMAGGAAVLGYLRKKAPENAPVVAYSLFGAACIAILIFVITGHSLISKKPPEEITLENAEEYIKVWADHLAMSLERQPPSDTKFFDYVGHVRNSDPVDISRGKEKPGYLQLAAQIALSPEHQAVLAKMSKQESTKFVDELGLELSRLKMGSSVGVNSDAAGNPIQLTILLQKAVPISNLNEGYFSQTFDEMTSAVAEVRAVTNLAMATSPIPQQPILPKQPRSQ
jgi:hypothetical protein